MNTRAPYAFGGGAHDGGATQHRLRMGPALEDELGDDLVAASQMRGAHSCLPALNSLPSRR